MQKPSELNKIYAYPAKLIRVIDGDSLHIVIDLGLEQRTRNNCRIKGIDTPELNSKDEAERVEAKAAKAQLEFLLSSYTKGYGPWFKVVTDKPLSEDKYGRWLAQVILPFSLHCELPDLDVGHKLLTDGYAKEYGK